MQLKPFFLFVSFLRKKSVYSSFQREIPCSKPFTVFFSSITASIDQSSVISMEDVAQIIIFFFDEEKPLKIS